MVTDRDIAAMAGKLSRTQKAWLVSLACLERAVPGRSPRWMTFPPASTHKVLMAKGLVDSSGHISKDGIRVRQHLLNLETKHG